MTTTTHDFVLKLWIYCLNVLTSTHTHKKKSPVEARLHWQEHFVLERAPWYQYPPHFQEDLAVLSAHFEQGVKMASVGGNAQGVKVVRLELLRLPWATVTNMQTDLWLAVNVTQTVTHQPFHFIDSTKCCNIYIYIYANKFMMDCECNTNSNTQSHSFQCCHEPLYSLYPSHKSTFIWLLLPTTATVTHKCILHKHWKFDMHTTCKHTCMHVYTPTLSFTLSHTHTCAYAQTHTHTHTYLWIMAGVRSTSGFSTVKVKFFPFFSKYPVSFLFMIAKAKTFNAHNMVFTIHTFC